MAAVGPVSSPGSQMTFKRRRRGRSKRVGERDGLRSDGRGLGVSSAYAAKFESDEISFDRAKREQGAGVVSGAITIVVGDPEF